MPERSNGGRHDTLRHLRKGCHAVGWYAKHQQGEDHNTSGGKGKEETLVMHRVGKRAGGHGRKHAGKASQRGDQTYGIRRPAL